MLRYGDYLEIPTLNPHLATAAELSLLSSLTMAYLVRYDRANRPVPELATVVPTQANGGVSRDGETITWHLRRGVRWSDGAPFSADDVVWTVRAILDPANDEVGRDVFDQIAEIREPDAATVVMRMKRPVALFLPTMFGTAGANPCILPKHLLAGLPNINHAAYNSLPVGIGPFRYTRWVRGDRIELQANPTYWRGRPKLDEIVYRIIPDRNTLLAQAESGGLDLWPLIPPTFADRVTNVPGFTTLRRPSFYYDHLDFNTSHPAGADAAVRRALRLAIDRRTLAQKLGHGAVIVQESVVPQAATGRYVALPLVPYDPAAARALLDRDGWVVGADGIRTKGGRRLSLDVATEAGAPDTDARIELIRGWWKAVGAEMNVKHFANGQFFAPYADGGIVYGGKFDVAFFAWGGDVTADEKQIYGSAAIPPAGQNDSRYRSAEADRAMIAYQAAFDPAKAYALDRTVQQTIARDAPVIVYDSRIDTYLVSRDLKHFDPGASTPFDDMMDVDI